MAFTARISTGASATWGGSAIVKLRDITFRGSAPAQDVTGQSNGRYRDYIAGLRREDWDISVVYDPGGDATHALFRTDKEAGTAKTFAFTSPEAVVDSFSGRITSLSEPETIGDAIMADLTILRAA